MRNSLFGFILVLAASSATAQITFTPTGGTTSTTLPDFGDRSLSLLDFGGVPNWSTDATTALSNAETAALAQGVHVIRLDCTPNGGGTGGCGYVIGSHTVPDGITLYCPGPKAIESPTLNYQNFPNAIVESSTAGIVFSGHSGEVGCNFLQQNLALAATPTTEQDLYTRQGSFTGTGVTCNGNCTIRDSMMLGFDTCLQTNRGARSAFLEDLQFDCNKDLNIFAQGPGGVINAANLFGAPLTTRGLPPLSLLTLPVSGIGDNGAGELQVTLSTACTSANCPLNGYKTWIRAPNGVQSAQGGWVLEHGTSTTFDLQGSISDFITSGYTAASATVTAGSVEISGISTAHINQIEPTQNVTAASCIPAGAQIAAVERTYGIIYLDSAHAATCSTTENITITDDSTGVFSVSTATLVSGGTNYQANDAISISGGTYPDPTNPTPAVILVDTVDATTGAILTYEIQDGGSYTTLPSNPVSTTGSTTGSGATFNIGDAAQLVLDPSVRPGPNLSITNANAVKITNANLLGGAIGLSLGDGASGVTMTNSKFNDENYLQDPTHIGILLHGTAGSNSLVNCGVYYFGFGLLSQEFKGATSSPDEVSHCHLGGRNGASGLQAVNFQIESPSAKIGHPRRQGIILDNNFSDGSAVSFVTDDVYPSQLTGNALPGTMLYGQSDATALLVSGSGNVFAPGSMPIFARDPGTTQTRVTPATASDVYLTNAQCGQVTSSGSAGGQITVHLPPSPFIGCRETLRPVVNAILVDSNGNAMRTVDVASQTTPLLLPGAAGSPQVQMTWNGSSWETDGGVPNSIVQSGLGNAQTIINGQVYLSCSATCSGGSGQLRLFPYNAPGGLEMGGVVYTIPSTGVLLDNSAFNMFASALRYIYAVREVRSVSAIANNGGHAQLTLASIAGFNSGDAITCVNMTGTPLTNVYNDTNTVLSIATLTITLTDVSFAATGTGTCYWTGLVSDNNPHATLGGIEVNNKFSTETLVGMVWIDGSHNLNDTPTKRDVASWYNPQQKKCVNTYTADRSTSSAVYAEPNSEIECEFVSWGPPATPGLPTFNVPFSLSGMMTNNTVSDGEAVSVGFDTTSVNETEQSAAGNAGTTQVSYGIGGTKTGLAEGKHFATILAKSISGGATTLYAAYSSLEVWPSQ